MTLNMYSVNGPMCEVHLITAYGVLSLLTVIIYVAPLCATELELNVPALFI